MYWYKKHLLQSNKIYIKLHKKITVYLSIFLYVLTAKGDIRRVPVNQVLGVSFFLFVCCCFFVCCFFFVLFCFVLFLFFFCLFVFFLLFFCFFVCLFFFLFVFFCAMLVVLVVSERS